MLSGAARLVVQVPFWKMVSVGNDFVLVHLNEDQSLDLHELARQVSSRHFGIGSDGLLAVGMEGKSLRVRMFNPDGSEDFCGNGIRCSILHAFNEGWIDEKPTVLHLGHTILAEVLRDPLERGDGPLIRFQLDPGSYAPADVPHQATRELFDQPIGTIDGVEYRGSALTTGSAHTIIWRDTLPGDDEFFSVSPVLENLPLFPERTSIMWTQECATGELRLRIWERGAGETQGCGTGSTAAAIDYMRRRGEGGEVVVHNPGGDLTVSATSWDRPPLVSGYARQVFTGSFRFKS